MSAITIIIIAMVLLATGYVTYGSWLAKKWGVDPRRQTPAHQFADGKDYVAARPAVVLGHHFSSIAGSGPINGPIQAAVFGWLPVFLWIIIGGIFFGAMHDFGALFASIRHKGQSIGTIIAKNIGTRAKRLFIIFAYLTLLLLIGAFASIVASTFDGFTANAAGEIVHNSINGSAAAISCFFIIVSILFGFFVYRRQAPLVLSTVIGVAAIVLCIFIGMKVPIYLSMTTWLLVVGVYIYIASITPVWILLQPRDYLSSFLLYGMIIAAIIGIFGANPAMNLPAFTGFSGIEGNSHLFPILFITVACGAISGFHSLVGSGTTAKQLDNEKDAKVIGYGAMLIECLLAVIALIAVSYLFKDGTMPDGSPAQVFAAGLATMINTFGATDIYNTVYALIILAVSAFTLTSLDTSTRLARYMWQEFFLQDGESLSELTGWKKVVTNSHVATLVTVGGGIALAFGGYRQIWDMFGAANQLLAGLALLAVAAWLGNIGKNNKMFFFPMAFMLVATISALALYLRSNMLLIMGGAATTAAWLHVIFSVILIILAIVLAIEGIQTLFTKKKAEC